MNRVSETASQMTGGSLHGPFIAPEDGFETRKHLLLSRPPPVIRGAVLDVAPEVVELRQLIEYVEATFRPMTTQKSLDFTVTTAPGAPVVSVSQCSSDSGRRPRARAASSTSGRISATVSGRAPCSVDNSSMHRHGTGVP